MRAIAYTIVVSLAILLFKRFVSHFEWEAAFAFALTWGSGGFFGYLAGRRDGKVAQS